MMQHGMDILSDYDLPGAGRRFIAYLIDKAIIIAFFLVGISLGGVLSHEGELLIWTTILAVLIYLFIQVYLLTTKGQTIGKKLLKIKIVQYPSGMEGGFTRNFLLRYFVNNLFAYLIPLYGIVDVLFIFSEEQRCLHDRLAGTMVIQTTPALFRENVVEEVWQY